MKKTILLFAMMIAVGTVSSAEIKLYATFGTPASSASYTGTTYTWSATNNNLMTVFEFSNGELVNYSTLKFTIGSLTGGMVRMGYYVGEKFTEFGNGFGSSGEKTINLTALNIDLSKVTKIAFGGRTFSEGSSSGSCTIDASSVFLVGTAAVAENSLTATFGTPASSAAYGTLHKWTNSTSNLMTVFEFANGELKDYTTFTFTFSNLVDGPVRAGYYVGDTFTEFGNGYYSAGTKTVDLTALDIDLSTVTKIVFGGRSNAGSCIIKESDFILSGTSVESKTATFGTPAGNATNTTNYYAWTSDKTNLMNVFTFADGKLAQYTKLTFIFSNLSDGASVRMGYSTDNGSNFTEIGNGFYSEGEKTVNLLDLKIDLSTVTNIMFGGRSSSGNCVIAPANVVLDNSDFISALSRQFTIGQKSTVCLPFNLTEAEAAAAGKFYTLVSAVGNTLHFTEVEDPAAYTPYVFMPATAYPFAFLKKNIVSSNGKSCETKVDSYTFHGVLASGKVPENAYGYDASTGDFSKATSANVNIDAFRAYITVSGASARLEVSFDDDELTAIQTVKAAEAVQDDVMYNLQGQRVGADHKGLVIKNGKKYIIK